MLSRPHTHLPRIRTDCVARSLFQGTRWALRCAMSHPKSTVPGLKPRRRWSSWSWALPRTQWMRPPLPPDPTVSVGGAVLRPQTATRKLLRVGGGYFATSWLILNT